MRKLLLAGLALLFAGCADPYVKMEGYFVKEETAIKPADNVERAVAQYASFKLYSYREQSFPEVLKKKPLPPQWVMLFFQVPDRWEFRPVNGDKIEGVIHFRQSADGKPKTEVKVVLTDQEMYTLARSVVAGPAYLDFVKKHDPKFNYGDVKAAAEYVRNGLIREIFTSSVPADVGRPMIPVLIDAAEKGYYTRFCMQNLQIITGLSFGYVPEGILDPETLLKVARISKTRQDESIRQWRQWYENSKEKTPKESPK